VMIIGQADQGVEVLAENQIIGPGYAKEINIPERFRKGAMVRVRGYYEVLEELISSR
jgi:hypothetical protein